MITLKRFESLAESYGGQLWRWPEDSRNDAEALLNSSAEARRILDQARMLDETIGAAARPDPPPDAVDARDAAALARLRSAVAMRLEATPSHRRRGRFLDWVASSISAKVFGSNSRWVGVAACGAVVVVAGVITGLLYEPPRAPPNLLSILQPEPMQIFSDQ